MTFCLQLEEERAKKETTSPTKLPVVMEAQEPAEPVEKPATDGDQEADKVGQMSESL